MTILVLGGTGKTGRRVAQRLQQRGHDVRPAARSTPTRFDWHDEDTWQPALAGVRAAYVVDPADADAATRLAAFGKLATEGGVQRLVLLSARDWAVSGGEEMLAAERAVQGSGAEWTVVRPTWFQQNFAEESFLRDPVRRGEMVIPQGDGLEPFISAEDIADVAVAALTEDGHAGQVYELSGPRLISWAEVAGAVARATERDITCRFVSRDEYVADAVGHGIPAEIAESVATLFGWIAQGHNAHLSDGVQRVLGREPRDLADYITATAPTGVWNPEESH